MRPIVIAAGGTGGHFFPAEALAVELIARGERVVLMTDARRAQSLGPVFGAHEHHVIAGAGLAGRGVRALAAAGGLARGIAQARGVLRALRPAAMIGFGGYPAVAPLLAARLLRPTVRILLHEQNAVMGRANRFLARFADAVAISFPETLHAPTVAVAPGNPVRAAIRALAGQGYAAPDARLRLLVLGGSLGARVFADQLPAAVASLPEPLRARLDVTQQCRGEDMERVAAAYAAAGVAPTLGTFFPDVAALLRDAHLVIARAGASTVAELAASGRPSVLVPLPGAIDDHQLHNARALAAAGGAIVLPQAELTPATLAERLAALLTGTATLTRMADGAARLARPDAAEHLADLVQRHALMEARA